MEDETQTDETDATAAELPAEDEGAEGMEAVDADPGLIFDKLDAWLDGFFRLLPNIAVALVLLALFVGLGWLVAWAIRRGAAARDRQNLGSVGGSLVKWGIWIAGFLLAATIVVPTLRPGDLIAGLGIGSVAIGFAFKDILQNMLAGILILVRQPFEVGDQIISSHGHEGTVEQIETRATFIRTYDGRRVVIPNSDIYTNPVVVQTAFETRRSEYDVGIGYGDDFAEAIRIAVEAMQGVAGVLADPGPEALAWELADSAKVVRIRWWTKSPRKDQVHVFSDVIQAVCSAYEEAGIDMPFPTQVTLWHDQTEAVDGQRGRQREGWPAAGDATPRSREAVRVERRAANDGAKGAEAAQ
ncbi:mechanosensitive ion channel family protein [Jannaschia sp. W003]|uniref:mechanosensitive ion channel family protein n=1 Tax=Jannaschia sp. W003 TaxID=2867012 RepID=UPI0021A709D8|nr:mechanosensitive ion channel family protein [Jannaschia sp. W003]UWQ21203.1 mechanosensitive ion channel family protein [Jannaschia sp. W003]